jgi:hypothetical protein
VANIVNTGVRSLTSTTALPSGRTPGAGINISASTGDSINITNTGVLSITSGVGITVSTDAATGQVQITNSAPVVNSFAQVEINGDNVNRLLADAVSDVLNITSDSTITLSKTVGTDTLNIAVNPVFDLKGSVFGDDSTKIVDAVENKVYADFFGNLTGNVTGNVTGNIAGSGGLFTNGVEVGSAINGLFAAVGTDVYLYNLSAGAKLGLVVREGILNKTVLEINSTAKTIALDNTYTVTGFNGAVTGNIFTNLIDSADSSAITVTPATIFNSDVTVENDLNVTQRFLLRGSRVINLSELKSVVAASASFADFQTRIAALV